MKEMKLSEIFKSSNAKRVLALLMAMMLVLLVGCQSGGDDKKPVDSQNQSNVSSEPVSDDTTDTSSEEEASKPVSPYDGNIVADSTVTNAKGRTDANEITPIKDGSNLATNYKGYADKERNALRDEILNTPNTAKLYKLKGRVYYVSTKGSDSNDGLSPDRPIQTLSAIDSLLVEAGDAILFERGCLWRMLEKFDCQEGVIYGSYGKGRKPMFYGSPRNFAQEIWKPSDKKNVWKISYMYAQPANGFFDQGKEWGYQKLTLRALEKNTDFFLDVETATLYLYCDKGNPSKIWDSIEFGQEGIGFSLGTGVDDCIFDNLAVRYTGFGGFGGHYNNNGWTVTNCEVGYTGGQWLGTVRAGNGIGTWCGGENLTWDHNWIYQTFDSAISPQGNIGKKSFNYHDISMCYNLFEFNNCDIETWESCDDPEKGGPSDFYNYYMDNNICRFTSLGWGTRADDGGIRGIDGVHYGHLQSDQITGPFSFSNNIIDCPGRMIYKFTNYNKAVFDAWKRENNVYYIRQSLRTTNSLTFKFCWLDETTRVGHTANTKEQTIAAFKEFEPKSKVYWYK